MREKPLVGLPAVSGATQAEGQIARRARAAEHVGDAALAPVAQQRQEHLAEAPAAERRDRQHRLRLGQYWERPSPSRAPHATPTNSHRRLYAIVIHRLKVS